MSRDPRGCGGTAISKSCLVALRSGAPNTCPRDAKASSLRQDSRPRVFDIGSERRRPKLFSLRREVPINWAFGCRGEQLSQTLVLETRSLLGLAKCGGKVVPSSAFQYALPGWSKVLTRHEFSKAESHCSDSLI